MKQKLERFLVYRVAQRALPLLRFAILWRVTPKRDRADALLTLPDFFILFDFGAFTPANRATIAKSPVLTAFYGRWSRWLDTKSQKHRAWADTFNATR